MPVLMVITGYPGTGKTHLSKKMGNLCRLPVISKDEIKETLFDTLGCLDREVSKKYGLAAYSLMEKAVRELGRSFNSCIIESNFSAQAVPFLQSVIGEFEYTVMQIVCTAKPELIVERFFSRWEDGSRHRGHRDDLEDREKFTALVQQSPVILDLPGKEIVVDTSDPIKIRYHSLKEYYLRVVNDPGYLHREIKIFQEGR